MEEIITGNSLKNRLIKTVATNQMTKITVVTFIKFEIEKISSWNKMEIAGHW